MNSQESACDLTDASVSMTNHLSKNSSAISKPTSGHMPWLHVAKFNLDNDRKRERKSQTQFKYSNRVKYIQSPLWNSTVIKLGGMSSATRGS